MLLDKSDLLNTFLDFTYGEMRKEKESGTLLGVGTAYLPVKEIKGEFYVKVSDFIRCMDSMRKELEEENKTLKLIQETNEKQIQNDIKERDELREENKKLDIKVASLEGEIKGLNYTIEKLREENQYREDIADILPEGEGHIAEETIQDLQKRIDELVWFEEEYHRSRERIKKLEWILEHEYNRKIPY